MLRMAAYLFYVRAVFEWIRWVKCVKCAGPHTYIIFFCLLDGVAGNRVRAYMKYFHGQFEKSL